MNNERSAILQMTGEFTLAKDKLSTNPLGTSICNIRTFFVVRFGPIHMCMAHTNDFSFLLLLWLFYTGEIVTASVSFEI